MRTSEPASWTLAEALALPEDQGGRVELVDGILRTSPAPDGRHQRVLRCLGAGLDTDLPAHLELLPGVNIALDDQRLLIPDATITTTPHTDVRYFEPADVLLVVEVISLHSRSFDTTRKRVLYAGAGIPYYLLVDPALHPSSATLFRLDGERFVEIAVSAGGRMTFDEPFSADIELL